MTYCSPIGQFNFGLGYLAGNCLSNIITNTFFGGYRNTMPFITNSLYLYNYYPSGCNFFSAPNTQLMFPMPDFSNITIPQFDTTSLCNNFGNYQFNVPQFNFDTSQFNFNFNNNNYSLNNYSLGVADKFEEKHPTKKTKKSNNTSYTKTGNNHPYALLTKQEALKKAKSDPNLEDISSGGTGWSVASGSFRNDIPFAKAGTKTLLDKAFAEAGIEFYVTSALGTKTSPHGYKDSGASSSHYNEKNPKLDLQPKNNPTSKKSNEQLAAALQKTGLFSRIYVETDSRGVTHLDVQLKDSAFTALA